MATGEKDAGALLTIGELARDLGVAQHILRYWESRFPQLKPMQRAGNRRYYRPADVDLARRIHRLLNQEGYTVRGVQKVLKDKAPVDEPASPAPAASAGNSYAAPTPPPPPSMGFASGSAASRPTVDLDRLVALRDRIADIIDL